MNIPEEAGKVATTAIDAMRSNPSCLAAILVVGMFALISFFANQREFDRRSRTVDILLNKCVPYVEEMQRSSHPRRDEGEGEGAKRDE